MKLTTSIVIALFLLLLAPAPALAQGPYPGEIRFLAGNYIGEPGWGECDGQWVPEDEYPELCSNLGDSYGTATEGYCALPDARGKVLVSVHDGGDTDFDELGDSGGEKTHTLTTDEMPAHTHSVTTRNSGTTLTRIGGGSATGVGTSDSVNSAGGGQAHNNMPPYLVVSCLIYLGGASAPTATPTATATSTPTSTPTITPTGTITPTSTPTGTIITLPIIYSVTTTTLQSGNNLVQEYRANAAEQIIVGLLLAIIALSVIELGYKVVYG